ncbi:MAG: rhodanese-like domain-containing protein [Planctomycetota bacterium]|jgi:rhodanese-related sulfurtransferase
MKRLIPLLALAFMLIAGSELMACAGCGCSAQKGKAKAHAHGKVNYIDAATVQKFIAEKKGLTIIDVLGAESYAKNHIKGAKSIPLAKLEGLMGTLKKDAPIIVYCANLKCKASTKAAKLLMKAGFTEVYDYEAGIADWVKKKLPIGTGKVCKCGFVKGSPPCCK